METSFLRSIVFLLHVVSEDPTAVIGQRKIVSHCQGRDLFEKIGRNVDLDLGERLVHLFQPSSASSIASQNFSL